MGMKATKYASNFSELLAIILQYDLAPPTQKIVSFYPWFNRVDMKNHKSSGYGI